MKGTQRERERERKRARENLPKLSFINGVLMEVPWESDAHPLFVA